MADDAFTYMSRWRRQDYLRRHAAARRAADKEKGARRIDVTLNEEDLDNYATVRDWLTELNETSAKIAAGNPRFAALKVSYRRSDTEVVRMALRLAAGRIEEERAEAAGPAPR
jgi:hypothetical protein